MAFDVLYARLPFLQHTNLPVSLGCELNEQGYLKVDNFQQTTVPGVYACGDNASGMRSVANAVASGNMTGAMVNMELVKERF
jgi:thioredoxin reductase